MFRRSRNQCIGRGVHAAINAEMFLFEHNTGTRIMNTNWHKRHRVVKLGLLGWAPILAVAVAAPLHAQPTGDAAAREARIDAIQAQLNQLQAQLAALRGGGGAAGVAAATPTPTTAPTASAGVNVASTARIAGSNGLGSGVPTTGGSARIDGGRPIIASADGRSTAGLLAVMQFDVADNFQHAAGPLATDFRRAGAAADNTRARNLSDGSTFRRARIGIAGKAFGDFEYTALFDFGGAGEEDSGHVQELWLQFSGWKPAHIRVGAFAPFIGLADAGSTNGQLFLERPAVADVARSLAGGDYREAAQIAFTGKRWFASGAVTGRLVNTTGTATVQPYQSPLGFIARAGVVPVKTSDDLIHLGVHGSYVAHPANVVGPDTVPGGATAISPVQFRERPELRVDGTRLIDTGAIDATHAFTAGAEVAAQHRNLFIQAEYERLGITRRASPFANPRFNGFYVEGSWVITGQQRRYNDGNYAFDAPRVDGSFNPGKGNYGVWELAARYSDLDLNFQPGVPGTALPTGAVRGGDQKIASAGLNWYLNSIARVMFEYQHFRIERLSPNAATYVTPVGAEIGQSYSAGSMRFQLAF